MIKAVIFDLDGTILYTLIDLANAMNAMLREYGYPEQHDLDCHRMAIGTGARNYVKGCLPQAVQSNDEQVDRCLATYRRLYNENTSVETKPYDGISDVLAFLTEQNISINVLSNKPDEPTKALVDLWFSDYGVDYAFGERVGVPRKPDPFAPLEIAEKLGLSPSEMAFIGDSDVDITTGKNAGMVSIGVLWGYRSQDVLEAAGAAHLAKTPQDLINIIKEYNQ